MCIFTGEVRYVGGTKIFARLAGPEQYLVYQMAFAADRELAMVLPLPVAPGMGESAVRFIDLAGYPSFFDDLAHTFPVALAFGGAGDVPAALPVHRVGEFDASFVPSGLDFGRLDARFRLRPELWQALPEYSDFGFAVFKLRHEKPSWLSSLGFGASRQPEVSRVHPMFTFMPGTSKPEQASITSSSASPNFPPPGGSLRRAASVPTKSRRAAACSTR